MQNDSAILWTFIHLSVVIKTFALSTFEWPVCKSNIMEGVNRPSFEERCGCFSFKGKYSKTCVKRQLSKRQKNGFQDRLSLNAGQKNCRMLQREHSAILSTFIKLPVVIKSFVLSIFDWLLYTAFTVLVYTVLVFVSLVGHN